MKRSTIAAVVLVVIIATAGEYVASPNHVSASRTASVSTTTSSPSYSFDHETASCCATTNDTSTTAFAPPHSYYWSMPMINSANDAWMVQPAQTIGISQAILLMRDAPDYVTSFKSNDTVQLRSKNITILVFGMMPDDAVNLTGMNPSSYSADDVFVIYGLINPTLVVPAGADVRFVFVNLDDDMYHNSVLTAASPPYPYMAMRGMMNGGMMGGSSGNFLYMMPLLPPADYGHGIAHAYSYRFALGGQTTLWYVCTYPGHAQSGMYGKVLVTG